MNSKNTTIVKLQSILLSLLFTIPLYGGNSKSAQKVDEISQLSQENIDTRNQAYLYKKDKIFPTLHKIQQMHTNFIFNQSQNKKIINISKELNMLK